MSLDCKISRDKRCLSLSAKDFMWGNNILNLMSMRFLNCFSLVEYCSGSLEWTTSEFLDNRPNDQ